MYLKGREDVQGRGHSVGCRAGTVSSTLPALGLCSVLCCTWLTARANYGGI